MFTDIVGSSAVAAALAKVVTDNGGTIRLDADRVRSLGVCMTVLGGEGGPGLSYGADGEPGGEGNDADIESWNID